MNLTCIYSERRMALRRALCEQPSRPCFLLHWVSARRHQPMTCARDRHYKGDGERDRYSAKFSERRGTPDDELWDVATFRQFDHERVIFARSAVVLEQFVAEPRSRCSD